LPAETTKNDMHTSEGQFSLHTIGNYGGCAALLPLQFWYLLDARSVSEGDADKKEKRST
jgi:hypothetical protein